MKTEAQRKTVGANVQDVSACPNCRTLMPSEMRFCRACGCRLGEGVEEYTETVRFDNAPRTARNQKSKTASAAPFPTSATGVRDWGTIESKAIEQDIRATTMGLSRRKG